MSQGLVSEEVFSRSVKFSSAAKIHDHDAFWGVTSLHMLISRSNVATPVTIIPNQLFQSRAHLEWGRPRLVAYGPPMVDFLVTLFGGIPQVALRQKFLEVIFSF